jgi:uncharacterized protein (TIGR04255 family)
MRTPGGRPHYTRPPIIEVVCGVQFEPIEGWGTPHYGKFWDLVEQAFEDQPPLPRLMVEPPAAPEPFLSRLPPLRRVFFIQPPGNFLIQLQNNRFLHNWRKTKDEDEYPRFDVAHERFLRQWSVFKEFLAKQDLSAPLVDAYELTYINHVKKEGAAFPRDVWEFLVFYSKLPEANTAHESSAMMMQFTWPLQNELGVLSMDIKHGHLLSVQQEVLLIELSARGKAKNGESGMNQWFEIAHEAIVQTFDNLTTPQAHELWGKVSQ